LPYRVEAPAKNARCARRDRRAGEHSKEAAEHHLETVLRVLRRQVGDRRLFPNHELQLGNEVDDELTI
jgi:hypothetical protein